MDNKFTDEQIAKVSQIITGDDIRNMMEPYVMGDKAAFERVRDAVVEAKFEAVKEVIGPTAADCTKEWMAQSLTATCHDMMLIGIKQAMIDALKEVLIGQDNVRIVTDPAEISTIMRGDAPLH